MILRGSRNVPGQTLEGSHGGKGTYFVRTLLEDETSSSFKHVRDLTLHPGSTIGEHLHQGEEELYFVIAGNGVIHVDGEEWSVSQGDLVLAKSGNRHALMNTSQTDLRILVVCIAVHDA